ncbi:MAG: FkbM family methyltransferase [Desulfuromonadales bacterium]
MKIDYNAILSRLFNNGSFPGDAFFIHKAFKGRNIIVYGAGESFHYFKEVVMRQYGYIPTVVLDRRFSAGDRFEGIPAFPPHEFHPSPDDIQNAIVVVCLGNQGYLDDVVKTLQQMGFRHIICLMDIYEIHNPFNLPPELESEGFKYYLEQRERIISCLDLMADDTSREVYIRCLQTHLQRKPVPVPMSPRHEQYTPQGIQLAKGYSRFIYCGVSVGEMVSVFSRTGKLEELVCFEPDPNQYRLTAEYLNQKQKNIAERVTAIPCAVYSHDAIEPFTYSDTSFGSRITPRADSWIQTVTIDHVLPGFDPTYIIMDIEGAELEALKGAENTIRNNRPDLAICLYHSPHHLWEIPLYLDGLGLGYRFYLRNYTSFIGETVLYATV